MAALIVSTDCNQSHLHLDSLAIHIEILKISIFKNHQINPRRSLFQSLKIPFGGCLSRW